LGALGSLVLGSWVLLSWSFSWSLGISKSLVNGLLFRDKHDLVNAFFLEAKALPLGGGNLSHSLPTERE
jgi:hypothetical protein